MVLDFSSVNFVDTTSAQALIDVRNQFNKYAAPEVVEWHFANVANRWTKRAIVASGFGYANDDEDRNLHVTLSVAAVAEDSEKSQSYVTKTGKDVESRGAEAEITVADDSSDAHSGTTIPVYGANRPFFHADVAGAVKAAIASTHRKDEGN